MKAKLTDRVVKGIIPQQTPFEVVDTEINGFRLRVQPSGVLTYYLVYRTTNGTKKRYRLGRHGAITVTQARDLAKQFSGKALSGQDIQEDKKRAQIEKEKMKAFLLGRFIELHYAPWVQVERRTGVEAIKRLNCNFPHLMELPLNTISPLLIETWRVEQMKRGKVAATVNRDIATLKSVLSKAVMWGWLEVSPLEKLRPLKTDNRAKVRYLSEDEERRLIGALKERDNRLAKQRTSGNLERLSRGHPLLPDLEGKIFSDHLTPMVMLSIHTGLRQGELFSLRWDHVDLSKALITVSGDKAKSGKTRHIPLNAAARSVLKTWNQQRSAWELVFPGKGGQQMDNIYTSWTGILRKANISQFRWHDLRHHFASKLVMAGVDLNTVRELLGHADLGMTLRYAHLAPEHKAEAVARLVNFSEYT